MYFLPTFVHRLDEKLIAHLAFGMTRGYNYICQNLGELIHRFNSGFSLDTGLGFIHKKHCVHRDVKPGNVLVHTNGMIKIAGQNVGIILTN